MKKIKKEINEEKEKMQILWMIFIIPIIFFILDITNIGHIFFPYIDNLNGKYDWLSFIGAYSGAIVSAIFLIFVTQKDREDSNEILRQSQRPYLNVNWMVLDCNFLKDNMDKLNRNIFIHNQFGLDGTDQASEYLVLEIKNTGASVAILDVNQSEFIIEYDRHEGIKDGEEVLKRQKDNVLLNKIIKRISISAGESMFIIFNSIDYFNHNTRCVSNTTRICNTKIYYKDLFNCNYEDICKYENGKIVPEKDNIIILDNDKK